MRVRLMMFSLNMVDYPMYLLSLSTLILGDLWSLGNKGLGPKLDNFTNN